jgi:hypothetical protein
MSVLLLAVKMERKKYAQALGTCHPVAKRSEIFPLSKGFSTVCLFSLMM